MPEAKLLNELEEIESRERCVSRDSISRLSEQLHLPRGQVEGVAAFYSFLSPKLRGEFDILLSDCVSDHFRGHEAVAQQISDSLGVKLGETRADGRVSAGVTSCTGMCDQGPSGLLNGLPLTRLTPARIRDIAGLIERRAPIAGWPSAYFAVADTIRRKGLVLEGAFAPGEALRELLAAGPEEMLTRIDDSGLRGRGGAGFRTGLKWKLCREAAGEHVVVCNADEGEPGTFKDRVLLQTYASLVIEGMTVSARIVGARRGFVYLRAEYGYLQPSLEAELRQRRSQSLLGRRILDCADFDFDIEIRLGAGAYICGEESALIESLEDRRGVPRIRPPFPVTVGYQGQPTVVNNVETFAAAARIAIHGPAWFKSVGTEQSSGTKLLSVSGDCGLPGVYELPMGVSLAEVLAASGAVAPRAVQVSGPAGVCVGPAEFNRHIAYEDLPAGGAVMIVGAQRDLLEVVANHARFFAHESCGFCTPCRVGTALQRDLVMRFRDGAAGSQDLEELTSIARLMRTASHCGLGQMAGNPILDTVQRFPELYQPGPGGR